MSWIAGDEAGEVAQKVVDVAKQVTGVERPEDALSVLKQKPELVVQLQLGLAQVEVELYKAETERLQVINDTMRAEGNSTDPWQRRWRPTWGFVTAGAWGVEALAIVGSVAGATAATLMGKAADAKILLDGVSNLISAMALAWTMALAVLGVQITARSQEKGGGGPGGIVGMAKSLWDGGKR
ncbi:3TM-type holin [Magnetospirillum molischianum]|uniref:3TM-type holin n=1 Tax=Magnetospirillum molischianum TaxID=1083 RepID=UPI00138AE223|nr:3TM-type holin [Magnetospirillum molischianum]